MIPPCLILRGTRSHLHFTFNFPPCQGRKGSHPRYGISIVKIRFRTLFLTKDCRTFLRQTETPFCPKERQAHFRIPRAHLLDVLAQPLHAPSRSPLHACLRTAVALPASRIASREPHRHWAPLPGPAKRDSTSKFEDNGILK